MSSEPVVTPSSVERYRCGPVHTFPVGDGLELVYSEISRSTKLLQSDLVQLLKSCQTFRSLDQHALECCRALQEGEGAVQSIKNQLVELVSAGLLNSDKDLVERLALPAEAQMVPVPIASVGCRTRDRVDTLSRCLDTYIENCQKRGKSNDFVVTDDSQAAGTRNACQQMLGSLKARFGARISYAGLEEKRQFAQQLLDVGDLPSEVVDFALFDSLGTGLATYGANFNALLLHTVGDTIFSVDDDTLCRGAPSPEMKDGLALVSGKTGVARDPQQTWVFPDREAAVGSVSFADIDVLAMHERFLGRDLRSCIAALSNHAQVSLSGDNARILRMLESREGRVLLTLNGRVGDCCYSAPSHGLFMTGKAFQQTTRSESEYRSACASRGGLRVVSRATISDQFYPITSTFIGLDNRNLLPPFMPVGRGADLIFGSVLSQLFYDGYCARLPWALLHMRVEPQSCSFGLISQRKSAIEEMWKLVMAVVEYCDSGVRRMEGGERLRRLGNDLKQIGSMADCDFEELTHVLVWQKVSTDISYLEARLQSFGESREFWAKDVREYIDDKRNLILAEEAAVPDDLLEGRSSAEAREMSRRLVLNFGQLLYWWPEVVEVARDLRTRGYRLARPV